MNDLKKIAVIHDLSGLGKCSLTAAIPVISVMGVQACPLPTAVLSNQTGFESYFCDDYTDRMGAYMEEWKKRDFRPDGIYTGFLAGEAQAELILQFLDAFCGENTLVLVDPVMGDQGKAYGIYSKGLCEKMRTLSQKATVITPNLTEALLLLYEKEEMESRWTVLSKMEEDAYLREIEETGRLLGEKFGLSSLVITGIDLKKADGTVQIGNLVMENGNFFWSFAKKEGGSFSGTGDLFASVLSAGMVKGMSMEDCVKKAVPFLSCAIRDAVEEGQDRNNGVCFEKYLGMLL